MIRCLLALAFTLVSSAALAGYLTLLGGGGATTVAPSPDFAFTPLHTYFMASNGNDACNGTSPTIGVSGSCAWATPNHAVVCGDVIIANTGNYNPLGTWGTVSSCPSTSGGIDGTGGIYFASLICSGKVGTCQVNHPTGHTYGMPVNASNWAIEGWTVSEGYTATAAPGFGFTVEIGTSSIHHIAFINDISTFNAGGFTVSTQTGSLKGYDYIAAVGVIAQDSAGRAQTQVNGETDGAIDWVVPTNLDTNPGTHIINYGDYSYNNQQTAGTANADGECYMFDTLDAFSYSQQIYMADNYCAIAERYGLQFFYQANNVTHPPILVYNNTFYGSNICAFQSCGPSQNLGDINLAGTTTALPWAITLGNNIASEKLGHPTGEPTSNIYALLVGGTYSSTVTIGSGSIINWMKGLAGTCGGFSCDPGDNVTQFNGGSFGTSTYTDPGYTNVTDLVANQIGAPGCTSFENVAQCMGYDARTSTLTTPSFISDLIPTASGTSGKGAQLPSTTCASETAFTGSISGTALTTSSETGLPVSIGELVTGGTVSSGTYITAGSSHTWTVNNSQTATATGATNYPLWLKGIVYLVPSGFTAGATISEHAGLVTKPCNL